MKNYKCAPRAEAKSGNAKLMNYAEWVPNSGVLYHMAKVLYFILLAQSEIKKIVQGVPNFASLCIASQNFMACG